jgi:hypothetical protein
MTRSGINPYCAGTGRRPAVLAGRGRQLQMIERMISQFEGRRASENVVWSGLRGMGKTVLLQEALDLYRDRGWLAGYHEVRRGLGVGESVASILLQGQAFVGRGKLSRALAWLREQLGGADLSASVGEVTVRLGLGSRETRELPADALDSLFTRLGAAAADAGVGAVFLLDEVQLMDRGDLSALLHAAQAVESLPVGLVLAGLPDLPNRLAVAGTYAERLFYDRVDWLSDADVTDAIAGPASSFDVSFAPSAIGKLVEVSRSYPYFVQLFAEETWWAAGTPSDEPGTVIGFPAVADAIAPAMHRLDEGLYRIRFEKASALEQDYLREMAELGDGRVASGDVARRLGKTAQGASAIRDRLVAKGIVYSPAHNVLEFSVPGFAGYVRRRFGILP